MTIIPENLLADQCFVTLVASPLSCNAEIALYHSVALAGRIWKNQRLKKIMNRLRKEGLSNNRTLRE